MAIILLLVSNQSSFSSAFSGKVSEKIDSVSGGSLKVISFEEKVKSLTDESIGLLEPCSNGIMSSLELKNLESAEDYLDICYTNLLEQERKLKELKEEALTLSDRREIKAIELDVKISFETFNFIQEIIDFSKKGQTFTKAEAKEYLTDIISKTQGLVFQVDMLMENYKDTYYYQEYLDSPESRGKLSFAKGQLDTFQRLVDQIR